MPSDFLVRRMQPADLDRILEIEHACFRKDAYDRNLFAAYARKCGGLFLIARDRKRRETCGYILTCRHRGGAELVSIAVDPVARTRGAASALMESTLRRLKRNRTGRLILMVKLTNWRALRFYRKFGFEKVKVVKRYYEDGRDGWLMEKRLRP